MPRVGILGGTFDPPHFGHLLAASDAVEALRLDRLLFIPARSQPLKGDATRTSAGDRLEMVRRLVEGDVRFVADPVEINRDGLSYSVDTLRALAQDRPGDELFFLVGADVLTSLGQWRTPLDVMRLARLVVLRRPGGPESDSLPDAAKALLAEAEGIGRGAEWLPTRLVDISSTEIRARVQAGLPLHGFVPQAVSDFIEARRLYR